MFLMVFFWFFYIHIVLTVASSAIATLVIAMMMNKYSGRSKVSLRFVYNCTVVGQKLVYTLFIIFRAKLMTVVSSSIATRVITMVMNMYRVRSKVSLHFVYPFSSEARERC